MAKDLYGILGLSKDASQDDVKAAYRKMSKEWHPDKHKGDKAAEQKFKEINEAYEVLGNPDKRKAYDQFGTTGGPGGGNPFGGFDFSQFQGAGVDFGDLFENFFGSGGGRGRPQSRTRGDDKEIEIAIDFLDAVKGVHRDVDLRKLAACDTCEGSGAEPGSNVVTCAECGGTGQVTRTAQSFFGQIRQTQVCPSCSGSGKIPEKKCRSCSGEGRRKGQVNLTIDVPAGIADGQSLRITGQGDAGIRGGEPGDLYVRVYVRPDPRFERDDADIKTSVHIPVTDAILGADLNVETVHGGETIRIPEGMQPGQMFRLKGKGMPVLGSGRHGDHYVTVHVEIPKKLGRDERKLLEEWRNLQK